ncbi:putative bifunctional chitinase/lysozyme [Acanthocystis turfacea Chlorella virus GM0701.1]|nr:putative bifunctional chitinase/lysozyme [Acanthocystis turfacea Chlorella virus GM0701.1]
MTRISAHDYWNKVTSEFLRRHAAGEDFNAIIAKLKTKYTGIGPGNQQRLRDLITSAPAPAPTPTPAPAPATGVAGKKIFASYTESWSLWEGWNGAKKLVDIPTPNLTLAFVLDGGNGVPKFDGTMDINSYVDQAKAVQAKGGVIRISFGGASGTELAVSVKNDAKLVAAYESVIKMYNTRYIDFDVEGASTADTESIKRRNKAIVTLQKKYPDLKVDYTLATMQTGMPAECVDILKDAAKQGVRLNAANLMAMDYGTGEKQMGKAAISAAKAAKKQCDDIKLVYTGIGITPMILVNDTAPETFTVDNAKEVTDFAKKTAWVNFLGMWATGRDTKRWDFIKTFNAFNA